MKSAVLRVSCITLLALSYPLVTTTVSTPEPLSWKQSLKEKTQSIKAFVKKQWQDPHMRLLIIVGGVWCVFLAFYIPGHLINQHLIAQAITQARLERLGNFNPETYGKLCLICTDEFSATNPPLKAGTLFDCGHPLDVTPHVTCVCRWILKNPTCPTCRTQVRAEVSL